MVLNADTNSVFLSLVGALPQIRRNPILNLGPGMTLSHRLPGLVSHLRIGKHADHGRAQLGRHLHILLNVVDAGLANRRVGGGEVVAHTGPADADAEIGRFLLETVDVGVGRHSRIAREIISGGVEAVELVFRGEVEELRQRDALAAAADGVIQKLVEGVRVE